MKVYVVVRMAEYGEEKYAPEIVGVYKSMKSVEKILKRHYYYEVFEEELEE